MVLSLPGNPDLERFRRDARRLHRAVRRHERDALTMVAAHHPEGDAALTQGFALHDAQLVVARAHGFASWPRLREFLRASEPLRRDPTVLDGSVEDPESNPAHAVAVLGCLQYSGRDEPARWAQAVALLDAHPGLAHADVVVAAVAGDVTALRDHLDADPRAAGRAADPFRWPPLLYLVYSRVPQQDSLGSARLLLDFGADPDSGYLWQGLVPPFTALTGCFGEGEGGPGRQPRHPRWRELALLLLERGADPNDGQTLYNRMFNRDDSHLEVLLAHGLGRPSSGVWARRTAVVGETVDEMMERQLRWAHDHGLQARLELLARHGFTLAPPRPSGSLSVDIHRAATPEAVREAVAAGADVNAAKEGRSALHQAAFMGDLELITALLEAGADPTAVDGTHGTTPLSWAEWARQPEAAQLLRTVGEQTAGAAPDARG